MIWSRSPLEAQAATGQCLQAKGVPPPWRDADDREAPMDSTEQESLGSAILG